MANLARERGAEVLLVVQTMAVPPAYLGTAIAGLSGLPIILWAVTSRDRLGARYGEAEITTKGATVGTPMITNVLVREGRPFHLVMGGVDDAEVVDRVFDSIAAASAASRIRRARVGLVGQAPDGYDCVTANAESLRAQLGLTVVPIESAEVRELYGRVSTKRVHELMRETHATFDIDKDAAGEPIDRSLRLACAIEDLVHHHQLVHLRIGQDAGEALGQGVTGHEHHHDDGDSRRRGRLRRRRNHGHRCGDAIHPASSAPT